MSPFRKSRRRADIPTATPPVELVPDLTSQRDSRALAATSIAIALSIGSAFEDTRGTSSGGNTVQDMDAMGQTAYSAVRMAVEVVKESSDMFLPLKAVAGAMFALMRNYDVSIPCSRTEDILILCLFVVPANGRQCRQPEGYRTEGAVFIRRAYLSCGRGRLCREREKSGASEVCSHANIYQPAHPSLRKLEVVTAKLEPLSEQHALLKFLRNVENVKILNGFAQELADAITDYQVRAVGPTVIFNERLARFRCNKECMRGRGTSMAIQRTSTTIPKTSITIPRTFVVIPRISQ